MTNEEKKEYDGLLNRAANMGINIKLCNYGDFECLNKLINDKITENFLSEENLKDVDELDENEFNELFKEPKKQNDFELS